MLIWILVNLIKFTKCDLVNSRFWIFFFEGKEVPDSKVRLI